MGKGKGEMKLKSGANDFLMILCKTATIILMIICGIRGAGKKKMADYAQSQIRAFDCFISPSFCLRFSQGPIREIELYKGLVAPGKAQSCSPKCISKV